MTIGRVLRRGAARVAAAACLAPLHAALARPRETQERVLRSILRREAETAFGRAHGFARLVGVDDYRRAVPVQDHGSLAPWIERQMHQGETALTMAPPLAYARTSGTTAAAKLVPVTARGLAVMGRHQRWSALALSREADILAGSVGVLAGDAEEDRASGGQPCGAATGLLHAAQPWPVRRRMALPAASFAIGDHEARYTASALLLLARGDLSVLATANPSTLIRLLDLIEARFDALVGAVATGDTSRLHVLGPCGSDLVGRHLVADPARARRLSACGPAAPASWWPRLAAVVTWCGGSCVLAARRLRTRLGDGVLLSDPGYLASEVTGTVPLDPRRGLHVPMLLDHLFEFVPAEQGRNDIAPLGLHELEEGRDYAVVVTTPDGLYRYAMNDVLRVTGFVAATPCLAFVQKSEGFANITGEKLHESQVRDAVAAVAADFDLEPAFFMALADEARSLYRIHVECDGRPLPAGFADALDAALAARNLEYAAKRASGRLGPPAVSALASGTGHRYRVHCVGRGQRDAQYKAVPLSTRAACSFDFDACRAEAT